MTTLDIEAIKQRLAEAKRQCPYEQADRHEAKNQAWSDFYQHAPSDIEALLTEIERLTPRVITTLEKLDAAPMGTIILDPHDMGGKLITYQKTHIAHYRKSDPIHYWEASNTSVYSSEELALARAPYTILHTPHPTN